MRNVVICFTGFTERSDLKQWASAVHRMGGSVRPQLVTTTLSTYLEPVPEPVVLETTPVASPGLTTTNNNMAVHSNGVAGGASTTPSSTNTTQSVSSLSTGVEGRATALSSYFDSRSRSQRPVTHLVARIADGDKYRSAFTLSIPIVRPAWIEHSWRLVASKSPDPAAADLNFSASDPSYLVPYTCAFSPPLPLITSVFYLLPFIQKQFRLATFEGLEVGLYGFAGEPGVLSPCAAGGLGVGAQLQVPFADEEPSSGTPPRPPAIAVAVTAPAEQQASTRNRRSAATDAHHIRRLLAENGLLLANH